MGSPSKLLVVLLTIDPMVEWKKNDVLCTNGMALAKKRLPYRLIFLCD